MSKRSLPNHAEILALMRHFADVAALKGDPVTQRQVLVDGLNELLGTHCGFFYIADDWRPTPSAHFTHQTLTTQRDEAAIAYMANFGSRYPLDEDPFCYASKRDDADVGSWTLHGLLPDDTARRQYHHIMEVVGSARWRDGVVTHFRTGERGDRIVGISLHRLGAARPISDREQALHRLAIEELRHLAQRGHLDLTAASAPELSPRLRQVLDRILAGHNPKAIARELGLSVWTVREHMQRLYTHFGVRGREELMARFVR